MADLPTGTITFLFTDIEGSTRLAQQHPLQWEVARQRHHAMLRAACEVHQGHVFQIIGDAFCVAFATAPDALAAAIEAQRALQSEAWRETPIRVRMGLHTGAAEARGGEYHGYLTLAHVQRVMSVAYGGQTLVSDATAALLRGQLDEGSKLRDLGEQRLKGLLNPEHLWQLVAPDLPQDFPPLQSVNTIPNNLPLQVTSFVGRERELAELQRVLQTTRLLTLTGSGGVGKTRLSLQVAADLIDAFRDGVWFVNLAPLTDPALVPNTVANVLGAREEPGRPLIATLLEWLRPKQLLLILDNCEHLIQACAQLADAVLHAGRETHILASSREALGIAGETAYRVPSLPSPNPKEVIRSADLAKYDAVRLWVERAAAARSNFTLTSANAPAVAQICYRLDGIPLAIELAAARVRVFPPEQIAARLDDRFRLLTGGSRTALPRQQTLRAAIDWSYNLLPEMERVLLCRLSVFAGGWTFDAAEQVCSDVWQADILSNDVLGLLTHLVEKSLVVVEEQGAEARYGMLETIRQYAREKLLESADGQNLRDRHLDYFVKLAEAAAPELQGRNIIAWLDRLEREVDNVRAALDWARQTGRTDQGLRLAAALLIFWYLRAHQSEGLEWLRGLLAQGPAGASNAVRAGALVALSGMYWRQASYIESLNAAEVALAIGEQLGDRHIMSSAYQCLVLAGAQQPQDERTQAYAEKALTLARSLQDRHGMGNVSLSLGQQALRIGDPARAQQLFAEAAGHFQQVGDGNLRSANARWWGFSLLDQGDLDGACSKFQASLLENREIGDKQAVAACLSAFGALALAQRDAPRAARLLGASAVVSEAIHTELLPSDELRRKQIVAALRAQLEAPVFDAAWAEGRAMTMDKAIEYALSIETGKSPSD